MKNDMNYLTADESMCDHLRGILEPVEVRDANGQLLGVFTPHVPPELLAKYEKVKKQLNLEEIKRRMAEGKGKGASLEEVLRRIQSREITG